jgi:two-component system, NarL family, nitrate/nitrite response regulator NarL
MPANVLLVEEHDDVRAALRDWLVTWLPPVSLREARSMEEALRLAEQATLDFALINVELPGNGIEAARELRKRYSKLRVVVMSVHESEVLRVAALEAGADAFVCKRELTFRLLPLVQQLMQRN